MNEPREIATQLQHFGDDDILGSIAPPIFQASNFTLDPEADWLVQMHESPGGPPYGYSRLGNPTVDLLERKIAKLEGADACKATGNGQAAIATTILACARSGGHVVCVDTAYGPVRELLELVLARYGVSHTFVSGLDADETIDAIRPETDLMYLESPSSLVMRLQDLRKITAACKEKGVKTAMDNTYATPLYQNPMRMGVDYVIHSASKYFSGHSDLIGGLICGPSDWIKSLTLIELNLLGTIMAPFPAWLTLRGLRTLHIRLQRHQESAQWIAEKLEQDPRIDVVHHLGLESFAQRSLFLSQMGGATGLFSFEPKDQTTAKAKRFVAALKWFRQAVSWGGYESLAMPLQLKPLGYAQDRSLVRLFIGLEDPQELWEDISNALDVAEL